MIRIEQWSLVFEDAPYTPPEHRRRCLHGVVYGHPRKPDGTEVTTSPIADAKGRIVHTCSSVYELGEVNPEYRAYVERDLGRMWDDEAPIVDKRNRA